MQFRGLHIAKVVATAKGCTSAYGSTSQRCFSSRDFFLTKCSPVCRSLARAGVKGGGAGADGSPPLRRLPLVCAAPPRRMRWERSSAPPGLTALIRISARLSRAGRRFRFRDRFSVGRWNAGRIFPHHVDRVASASVDLLASRHVPTIPHDRSAIHAPKATNHTHD